MKARILHDVNGTTSLAITAHHISAQLWNSGKSLIKTHNRRGKPVRAILLTKTHAIDIDQTPGGRPLRYALTTAAVVAVAVAAGVARNEKRKARNAA